MANENDQDGQQRTPDPAMEDILASIRRIITEEPAEALASADSDDEAPLELTDRVEDAPPEPPAAPTQAELEAETEARPEPSPIAEPPEPDMTPFAASEAAAAPTPGSASDTLVSAPAAAAAGAAFAQLATAVAPQGPPGRTLEDLAAELLRPMLKAWLDDNLETIVRKAVEVEVERISRQAR